MIRKIQAVGAFIALSIAIPAVAKSPFDGVWVGDVSSIQIETSPSIYELKDGLYRCLTCTPQQALPSDGQFHAIKGHSQYDEVSVEIVDPKTIRLLRRKEGRIVGEELSTVSGDGATLTFTYKIWRGQGSPALVESGSKKRVDTVVQGSHLISGSWVTDRIIDVSPSEITASYAVEGNTLIMSNPAGESYEAPLDGTDSPMRGAPANTTVSVTRIDQNTLEETIKRAGRTQGVTRMTVDPSGRTMKVTWENRQQSGRTEYVAHKQ